MKLFVAVATESGMASQAFQSREVLFNSVPFQTQGHERHANTLALGTRWIIIPVMVIKIFVKRKSLKPIKSLSPSLFLFLAKRKDVVGVQHKGTIAMRTADPVPDVEGQVQNPLVHLIDQAPFMPD